MRCGWKPHLPVGESVYLFFEFTIDILTQAFCTHVAPLGLWVCSGSALLYTCRPSGAISQASRFGSISRYIGIHGTEPIYWGCPTYGYGVGFYSIYPNAASTLLIAVAINRAWSSCILTLNPNRKALPKIERVCGHISREYSTFPL